VHIQSLVVHTTGDALTVMVNVQAEDAIEGEHEETLRAFLTYAPADAGRAPAPVTCASDDERAVFDEVEHRLAMQRMLEAEGPVRAAPT
jgi:acyl-CoA hydrolase